MIATAGLTLLTEALHLGKPTLALPIAGQFEQELNAALFAESGFGTNGRALDAQMIRDFLARLPELEERLSKYERPDGSALLGRLDELLADDAALAKDFHARRRELGRAPE